MRDADLALIDQAEDEDIPAVAASVLLRGRPLLVLAPHPDDESLGCGALLAQAFAGAGAHVACLTDGAASHPGGGVHGMCGRNAAGQVLRDARLGLPSLRARAAR